MTNFGVDYDKEIIALKSRIEELEQTKVQQAKKLEGIRKLDEAVTEFTRQYALEEGELYLARSNQIVEWVKSLGKRTDRPHVYDLLKEHFAQTLKVEGRKGRGKKGAAVKSEPILAVGAYRNPNSGETIEKKKRTPKTLEAWVEKYGVEMVKGWKQ